MVHYYRWRNAGMLSEDNIVLANRPFMPDSWPFTGSISFLLAERSSFLDRICDGVRRRWRRLVVKIASRTGRYDHWKEVDWNRVQRLVFVCSGNICRSPYAEALALSRGLEAISLGTTARGGAPADPVAIEVADWARINLRNHFSRHIDECEIRASDLLVIMDTNHLAPASLKAEGVGAQMTLLGVWDGRQPVVIDDPFGQPTDEFEVCFRRIDSCIDKMQHARRQTRHS